MRAFPGTFGVMTIVGADRALEVCFLSDLWVPFRALWLDLEDALRTKTLLVRSVLVYSEVACHVPFARKGTHKIALTGMLRSDESVTLGFSPRCGTGRH